MQLPEEVTCSFCGRVWRLLDLEWLAKGRRVKTIIVKCACCKRLFPVLLG